MILSDLRENYVIRESNGL